MTLYKYLILFYNTYYSSVNNLRKLTWLSTLGTGVIKVHCLQSKGKNGQRYRLEIDSNYPVTHFVEIVEFDITSAKNNQTNIFYAFFICKFTVMQLLCHCFCLFSKLPPPKDRSPLEVYVFDFHSSPSSTLYQKVSKITLPPILPRLLTRSQTTARMGKVWKFRP